MLTKILKLHLGACSFKHKICKLEDVSQVVIVIPVVFDGRVNRRRLAEGGNAATVSVLS